jgi:hypothetical protein
MFQDAASRLNQYFVEDSTLHLASAAMRIQQVVCRSSPKAVYPLICAADSNMKVRPMAAIKKLHRYGHAINFERYLHK